jgi:hypothetical protein
MISRVLPFSTNFLGQPVVDLLSQMRFLIRSAGVLSRHPPDRQKLPLRVHRLDARDLFCKR